MPPAKATPLKVAPNGANINTPTPSKPSSPSTQLKPSNTTTPAPPPESISSPHELTAFVETVLEQLESKFDDMSTQILERMSQMTARIDSLEVSINDLIHGDIASMPDSPTPGTPATRSQSLRTSA